MQTKPESVVVLEMLLTLSFDSPYFDLETYISHQSYHVSSAVCVISIPSVGQSQLITAL